MAPVTRNPVRVPFNDLSAAELANGKTKLVQPGDQLTKEQLNGVIDAFKKVPLKDLSPDALAVVKAAVAKIENETGKKIKVDWDKMTVGDIPGVGGKVAKALADNLKKKDPAAFYTLATAAVGGLAGVAYAKGSKGLEELGVPTEVGGKLGGVDLKLKTTWESGFEHAKGTGSASKDFKKYGKANVSVGGGVDGFDGASGGYSVGKDSKASVGGKVDGKGAVTVTGGGNVKVGGVNVSANGSANVKTGEKSGTAGVEVKVGDVSVGANGTVNSNGSKSGSVSVDVKVNGQVKVGAKANGSVDENGKQKGTVSGNVTYTGKKVDVVVQGSAGPEGQQVGVGVKVDLDREPPKPKLKSESAPKIDAKVMERALAKGEKAATEAELAPKGVDKESAADPAAIASAVAAQISEAIRTGKPTANIDLGDAYAKLGPEGRKQVAAAVEKITKAVAAEIPGSDKVASVKVHFGKEAVHVGLR